MLLVTLTKWNTVWIHKSVNIRRWGSLEVILESGYHSEEMVLVQQDLWDNRGKEDAVGSKLDQKLTSNFPLLARMKRPDLSSTWKKKNVKKRESYMKQRFQNMREKTVIPKR